MYNKTMNKNPVVSQASNYAINKKALADKKANGCEDCGFNVHPTALDLDHIDPRTKHVTRTGRRPSPGSMLSYNPLIFALELSKCRVLCKNCHSIHTYYQNKAMLKAGTNKTRGKGMIRQTDKKVV